MNVIRIAIPNSSGWYVEEQHSSENGCTAADVLWSWVFIKREVGISAITAEISVCIPMFVLLKLFPVDLISTSETLAPFPCKQVYLAHSTYVITVSPCLTVVSITPLMAVACIVNRTVLLLISPDCGLLTTNEEYVAYLDILCSVSGPVIFVRVSISDVVTIGVEVFSLIPKTSTWLPGEDVITIGLSVWIWSCEFEVVLFAV